MPHILKTVNTNTVSPNSANILFSGQNEALHSTIHSCWKTKLCPQTSHTIHGRLLFIHVLTTQYNTHTHTHKKNIFFFCFTLFF